jgi:hypothetical protein
MSKITEFRPRTSRGKDAYAIQYLRMGRWRTLPGLIYSTQKLAKDGMGRLEKYRPDVAFRVRVYRPPLGPISAKREPKLARLAA